MPPPPEALKLRQELKEWERAFADAHDGRKPTRDEIKKDVKIATKYTEYYKLQPSSKSKSSKKPSTKPSTESLKSKPAPAPAPTSARSPPIPHDPDNPFASYSTPRPSSSRSTKRPTTDDVFKTPSKHYTDNDLYDSPLSTRGRRLFGNRLRETVGPTPQKTGKVLGIFESFVDVETTPTHQRVLRSTPTTGNRCTTGGGRVSASPAERADAFTTPRKRKAGELSTVVGSGSEGDSPSKPTPKDVFSTPSFLRRDSSRFVGSFVDSPPVPLPMRPPVRGLSSMVAELRKMEDDAHDDEEEAMREMEAAGGGPPSGPVVKKIKAIEKGIVAELENDPDTGLPPPPEGAWKEEEREEEEDSADEKEDKTRKWKKKGLKRQHRRVIMRPISKAAHASDEEAPPNPEEAELPGAGYSDEDLSDMENEPEPEPTDPRKKTKTAAGQGPGVVEKVKKAARKVSEKAHTNYRRLNIRGSKGAKAGNGKGRFSRKRR